MDLDRTLKLWRDMFVLLELLPWKFCVNCSFFHLVFFSIRRRFDMWLVMSISVRNLNCSRPLCRNVNSVFFWDDSWNGIWEFFLYGQLASFFYCILGKLVSSVKVVFSIRRRLGSHSWVRFQWQNFVGSGWFHEGNSVLESALRVAKVPVYLEKDKL